MLKWHDINPEFQRGHFATIGNNPAKIFEIHWVSSVGRYVLTNFLPSSSSTNPRKIKMHYPSVKDCQEMADDILIRWLNQAGLQFKREV